MIRKIRSPLACFALLTLILGTAEAEDRPLLPNTPAATVSATVADLPLAFTQNTGQWPDSILFRAEAGPTTIWFTKRCVYYHFTRSVSDAAATEYSGSEGREQRTFETQVIQVVYLGARADLCASGEGQLEGRSNYFIGDDPARWRTDVPVYSAVVLEGLYTGIDLKYFGHHGQLEYDFMAEPGADLAQIQLRYEGARSLAVNEAGELVVQTDWATVTERAPVAYQVAGEAHLPVATVYELIDDQTFGFAVTDPVQPELALVIDPILTFSSYLGGSGIDLAHAVAVDEFGDVYVAGVTSSTNFPTQGPYQGDQGADDAFVLKLSADGQSLIYSTYLGGSAADEAYGLAVDDKGDAYVVGVTESTNFPTVNAFQGDQSFPDGFVTKLNGLGNDLTYSTYLGGSSFDEAHDVKVVAPGYAIVAGVTSSSNFPTKNPAQTDQAGDDAFVVRLSTGGDSLVYGTFLGGNGIDAAYAVALDGDENVYVTGQTRSSDLATAGAYQTYQGVWDAYVTKLNASGSGVVYSTYLGGTASDYGQGIAVDGLGQAYVTGVTSSSDFPTAVPFQGDMPSDDAFLVKLTAAGDDAVYATYLGGNSADYGRQVAVDLGGRAYVAGWTLSTNFPTLNPIQSFNDTVDAFVVIFNAAGTALDYGTYLSGSGVDDARGLAVTPGGDAYVAGRTDSPNFLTLNPYQNDQGGRDAFVLMLEMEVVGVGDDGAAKPDHVGLVANYPNPFNAGTIVSFALPEPGFVSLDVFNMLGDHVATLCDRVLPAGRQEIPWDGRDHVGHDLPSGVYLYRLNAGAWFREGKMVLLK